MKFQVAADKPKIFLMAAGLAIAFCSYLYCVVSLKVSVTWDGSAEELVYRHASHSVGGCSRSELFNNEVSTEALTGFTPSQLRMMPASFWRYEGGIVRISFARAGVPCEGPACKQPKPNRGTTFGVVSELSRNSNQQTVLINCVLTLGDMSPIKSHSLCDSVYVSMSYAPMERPPNSARI